MAHEAAMDAADGRPLVLFLCTANACRSQMGEALCRATWGDALRVMSAGVRPGKPDANAIAVLEELGIDMGGVWSKSIDDVLRLTGRQKAALVVTVCDNAAAECPAYLNARQQVHQPFRDPPALARALPPGADPLPTYREVRDEIAAFVATLPQLLPAELAGVVPAPLGARKPGKPPAAGAAADPTAVACEPATPTGEASGLLPDGQAAKPADGSAIGFFERWLTVWVLLCMVAGGLLGYYVPAIPNALSQAEFRGINAIMAVLLWLMLMPMFLGIEWRALGRVRKTPGAVLLTSAINYAVQPFLGYAVALLFFQVFYVNVIPDAQLRDSYIAGIVLLAGAPCTAMVFVWSLLVGGDGGYTLVQVAANDLLLLALYVPTMGLLLGVTGLPMPWDVIALSVAIFVVAPLLVALAVRMLVLRRYGQHGLDRLQNALKPVTMAALLGTLVLCFVFQGPTIGGKPLDIVLIAIPLILLTFGVFAITYAIGYFTCMEHCRLAPGAMIATSNFFELAVAVAISVYGVDSGAALATVVGVLVEVPVMLLLVQVCVRIQPWLEKRVASCPEVCPWVLTVDKRMQAACACSGSRSCKPRAATNVSSIALVSAADVQA